MGALQVGDEVFDSRGLPTPVRRVTPVFTGEKCYRLTFSDGEEIVASAAHGWTVERLGGGSGTTTVTLSTEQIAQTFRRPVSRGTAARYRIPLVATHLPKRSLALDPYLLGLWLGDGSTTDSSIACDARVLGEMETILKPLLGPDEEIVTWVKPDSNTATLRIRRRRFVCPRGHDYEGDHITTQFGHPQCRRCVRMGKAGRAATPVVPTMRERLRMIGVLGNKHIPMDYLRSGDEQRLALLQGLMDSDGHVGVGGRASFTNKNAELLDQFCDLLTSLGLRWNVQPAENGARRVFFTPPGDLRVARLAHKQDRVRHVPRSLSGYRHIVDVAEVDSVPVRCIGIDTPDHLFLAGRHGVLTHNTQNTMLLFKGLFRQETLDRHGIGKHQFGAFQITAHSGQRRIQAVTSSPKALEGARPTLVICNETHWWVEANAGHAMFRVLEDNATKSKGASARVLAITNAYNPADDSVAQMMREAWEDEDNGLAFGTGLMYDSLEADPKAVLRPELPEDLTVEEQEAAVRGYLRQVFEGVRGDAVWLDIKNMTDKVLRRSTKPADARRFWFNQVRGSEDAWVLADAVDAAEEPLVRALRARASDKNDVRTGWIVTSKEPVVMFFDGSKSDDSTALVGCRVSDGYTFVVGVWEKPRGEDMVRKAWLAPRGDVAARIDEAFDRFDIVAFFADPSHAEDEDGSRYWTPLLDEVHRKYRHRLKWWAQKSGDRQHAVLWDMASPAHTAEHASAAMIVVDQLERREGGSEDGPFAPAFLHDGHPKLKRHLKNARRNPLGKNLVGMTKEGRESLKKIDLAVALVGAQMLRTLVLNGPQEEKPKGRQPGRIW